MQVENLREIFEEYRYTFRRRRVSVKVEKYEGRTYIELSPASSMWGKFIDLSKFKISEKYNYFYMWSDAKEDLEFFSSHFNIQALKEGAVLSEWYDKNFPLGGSPREEMVESFKGYTFKVKPHNCDQCGTEVQNQCWYNDFDIEWKTPTGKKLLTHISNNGGMWTQESEV